MLSGSLQDPDIGTHHLSHPFSTFANTCFFPPGDDVTIHPMPRSREEALEVFQILGLRPRLVSHESYEIHHKRKNVCEFNIGIEHGDVLNFQDLTGV